MPHYQAGRRGSGPGVGGAQRTANGMASGDVTASAWQDWDDPPPDARALFASVAASTEHLTGALDDAGLIRQMRSAPTCSLQGLDRSLPRRTLDDLLAACEAFALVTGPTALAHEDHATLRDEAWRLLTILQGIERAARKRTRSGRASATTVTVNAALMREAFGARAVQAALRSLVAAFEELADMGVGEESRRRGWAALLPLGTRFLMPAAVMALALALVVALVSAVLVTTYDARHTPHSSAGSTPLKSATTPAAGSGQGKTGAAPTAAPPTRAALVATATPVPPARPQVAVSQLDQPPCNGGPDARFAITFSSGPGTVQWSASPIPNNPAYTALSLDGAHYGGQISGNLTTGQQVTVYVRALQDNTSQISVTTSAGAFTVTVDSSGC